MRDSYIPTLLSFSVLLLEFFRNLQIARHLLPVVRSVGAMGRNDRIKTLALAALRTSQIRFYRLFALFLIYLPVLVYIGWERQLTLPCLTFFASVLGQAVLVWVASNHEKIVYLEIGKMPRDELVDYLALITRMTRRN